jgi:hypothetical protein
MGQNGDHARRKLTGSSASVSVSPAPGNPGVVLIAFGTWLFDLGPRRKTVVRKRARNAVERGTGNGSESDSWLSESEEGAWGMGGEETSEG